LDTGTMHDGARVLPHRFVRFGNPLRHRDSPFCDACLPT